MSSDSSPRRHETHRKSNDKKRDIDTSEWKFIEEDTKHLKPKLSNKQSREIRMNLNLIDQIIEQELRETVIENIRTVVTDNSTCENASLSRKVKSKNTYSKSKINRRENEDILKNLKELKMESNPYLDLCNRLDEEEGIKMPSVEDKLKLAEDRLRVSVNNFCEACDELLETDSSEIESSSEERFLKPEEVHEEFRPKVFETGLLPPQTLSVSEVNTMVGITQDKNQRKSSKQQTKMKGILKQVFYLPCDTWFTKDKIMDKLTPEEVELLNSTSTKAFLRFLEERKKEPPKILQDIQKKLQETQKYEKQYEKEK